MPTKIRCSNTNVTFKPHDDLRAKEPIKISKLITIQTAKKTMKFDKTQQNGKQNKLNYPQLN